MPIYEYRCNQCGNEFEYTQRMSDAPKTACEGCGGSLERLISRSSFHLKGGGWYKDLYSSSQKSTGTSTDSKTDSGSSTTSTAEPSASSSGSGSVGSSGSGSASSSGSGSTGSSASSAAS